MAKKIVFFNHKGGVSKTTSVFNVGWKLAELGHKVLLVDGDPQCNLTSIFLRDKFYDYYENEGTSKQNIMDGVRPVFDGIPAPISYIDTPIHPLNNNLSIIPGHMNLSEYDPQLTFAINAPTTLTSMQNMPGAFNELISKTVDKYDIEYVLIDLNPGLSTTNQILFISSDAFIIPTNPDLFCEMAIKSLSRILPQWVNWKNQHIQEFESAIYPIPNGTPLFIGELIQRFNIRYRVAAAPYRPRIEAIKDLIKNSFAPIINKTSMLFNSQKYLEAGIPDDYCLAEIKDFQSLGQKSQELGIPVFALNDSQLDASGTVKAQLILSRDEFNTHFDDIANKIITLFNE